MMVFAIKNPDNYQTNDSLQSKDTRQKNQLHVQFVRLSSVQKGVCSSSIKIFNKLPPHIVQLHEMQWPSRTLNKSHKNALYSICEFLSGNHYDKQFKF
jgi:hypothetical protein